MAPKLPYFIIETNRPGYTVIDPLKNDAYADLKRREAARDLPKIPNASVLPRAESFQTEDMLMETYTDEEGGVTRKRFRDEVVLAQADDRGRLFIDSTKPDLARRILREVRVLDKTVRMDAAGQMLPEEMPNYGMQKNLGGRPRKNP